MDSKEKLYRGENGILPLTTIDQVVVDETTGERLNTSIVTLSGVGSVEGDAIPVNADTLGGHLPSYFMASAGIEIKLIEKIVTLPSGSIVSVDFSADLPANATILYVLAKGLAYALPYMEGGYTVVSRILEKSISITNTATAWTNYPFEFIVFYKVGE